MTAAEFFAASRVLIVAGKGGVGKTTVGATLGVAAARAGARTLLVELEGHSTLGRPFGQGALPYGETSLSDTGVSGVGAGMLSARRITPDHALIEYLRDHGLDRVGGRLIKNGAIDVVSTAAPGIRDLLTLGKIRQLEQSAEFDLIIVDGPAAGHAITFLESAAGLDNAATAGPVAYQAKQVLAMLGDEKRCQVILVTLPAETPVSETVEAAFSLEDTVGVQLGPVVVNSRIPTIDGLSPTGSGRSKVAKARRRAAQFRLDQQARQAAEVARLSSELPLATLTLPHLFTTELGPVELGLLADNLTTELDRGF